MSDESSCLIVAAHPDDETIGAGIWMTRAGARKLTLLHITDGSPRDMADARQAGFNSREAYAQARTEELHAAFNVAGIHPVEYRRFDIVDKEAYLHMPELVERTAALIREIRPNLVLSPAYEGGHPDHDTAALAIAAAWLNLSASFRHREYRLYHAAPDGQIVTDRFLPAPGQHIEAIQFSAEEQEKKRLMINTFKTQIKILMQFQQADELLREAPVYDFTRPPHEGLLLYERWPWGISGAEWRRRAQLVWRPEISSGASPP